MNLPLLAYTSILLDETLKGRNKDDDPEENETSEAKEKQNAKCLSCGVIDR